MTINVVVVYRVAQFWRVPLFRDLTLDPEINFTLIHFDDFVGTKVVSGDTSSVNSICLRSFNLTISFFGRTAYVPFSSRLFATLHQLSPDVVVCEGASNLIMNLVSFVYCKIYRKKLIQWSLGSLPNRSFLSKFLLYPFFFIERLSDAALVYSNRGISHFKELKFPDSKIYCAVNTVDNRSISQISYCPSSASFNLIYVGAMTVSKQPHLLLRAFSSLLPLIKNRSDYFHSAHLTFVGDGDLYLYLQKLSIDLGISQHVTFLGRQSGDALSMTFKTQDLLVMPGLGGLVVSEAIAHGLPVLASTGDGSEVDWLKNGCGVVKNMTTSQDILDALIDIARSAPHSLLKMHSLCSLSTSEHGYHAYYETIKNCFVNVARSDQ